MFTGTEDIKKILHLAEIFTMSTLGCENPQGKCFNLSYPLSLYLENNGFENYIFLGYYQTDKTEKEISHAWLTLKGDKEIVIDITGKQFDIKRLLVYRGKPNEYNEWDFTQETLFNNAYNDWLSTFTCEWRLERKYLEEVQLDLNVLLRINIKAAIILNNEIEEKVIQNEMQKGIINSDLYKKYFCGINKIWEYHKCLIESFKYELPSGFDALLLTLEKLTPRTKEKQ